jgi:hypothetical protein
MLESVAVKLAATAGRADPNNGSGSAPRRRDDHGMPGAFEQLWTRTADDGRTHELWRIPFVIYGMALGDARHSELHGALMQRKPLVEFIGDGYGAIDVRDQARGASLAAILDPWVAENARTWEWADRQVMSCPVLSWLL